MFDGNFTWKEQKALSYFDVHLGNSGYLEVQVIPWNIQLYTSHLGTIKSPLYAQL